MNISAITYLICCPLLFLAGLVDSIGGGGGLISLPAYLLAGLPVHTAIATNKLSSACGTTVSTVRFIKEGLINWKIAVPSIIAAIIGSSFGARLSLVIPETILVYILILVLPLTAFIVLNRKIFKDNGDSAVTVDMRTCVTAVIAALFIGFYDGFYGPGTGTFLIIAFTVFAHLGVKTANGQTKAINLTTNITSLVIFILHGQVLFAVGIPCALCNMAGNYIGSGLVMKNGIKVVRPSIMAVLGLLAVKIVTEQVF
ncbi:MAG: TSUP family transporter [Oribacterium sp.]|nr:TSUP family transporter [Oribacterium sp.]